MICQAECIERITRYLESTVPARHKLKQIGQIFGVNSSFLDRRFLKANGITVKAYSDVLLLERLLSLFREPRRYGYQYAYLLGFPSDRSAYHWVKRVFGKPFRELIAQQSTSFGANIAPFPA